MTYAYIGCRTTEHRNARGKGISVYDVDARGNWKLVEVVKTLDNPSYLSFDRTRQYLYSVHGDFNDVSAFKIGADGRLTFLNTVRAQGKNPVFLVPNKTNRFMFVATLQGGAVASLPICKDGTLGEAVSVEHLEGCVDGGVSHAHQCLLDNTEQYLFVPTQARKIGYERLWVLRVDDATGKLERTDWADARTYSEPRHVSVSSDNKHVYLVNEKGNSVTVYNFDETRGKIFARQIVSTLPETYCGQGQASASLAHPSGKFVYASNRIHESVAAYRVAPETGMLKLTGFTDVLGKTPRFMCFNHDATELIVANEDSDTLRFFAIDPESGKLSFTGRTVETPSPTCLIFK